MSGKHDSPNSSTQDSQPKPSVSKKPYTSGANVHKGAGAKPGGVGVSIAAGPKSGKDGT